MVDKVLVAGSDTVSTLFENVANKFLLSTKKAANLEDLLLY